MKTVNKRKNAIKIILSCFAFGLLLFGGLCSHSLAQEDPLVVRLGLKNPDGKYLFNPAQPDDDPIIVVVTVENVSGRRLLASRGYADNLDLLLRFADPDGFQVTAQNLLPGTSGRPLPVFPDEENEVNVPGEPVEVVEWGAIEEDRSFTREFNIRGLYLFPRPDTYTGKEFVPVGLYEVSSLIEGTNLARFLERISGKDFISNGVTITLIDDADNDGFCAPAQHPLLCPEHTESDCDDSRLGVNPGQTEILNNGLDDDCNPATLDVALVDRGTIAVRVDKHTTGKGGSKEPLVGMDIRAYDKSAGSCVSGIGVSKKHYESIWSTCSTADGGGITDEFGRASLYVAPGEYLLIGKCELANCGVETYIGSGVDEVVSGQTVEKYMQLIVEEAK